MNLTNLTKVVLEFNLFQISCTAVQKQICACACCTVFTNVLYMCFNPYYGIRSSRISQPAQQFISYTIKIRILTHLLPASPPSPTFLVSIVKWDCELGEILVSKISFVFTQGCRIAFCWILFYKRSIPLNHTMICDAKLQTV